MIFVSSRPFTFPRSRWPDAALVLLLVLLPCLFFWRLITPYPTDRMQIAAGDFTEQYFPLRAFAAQEWVRGQIPLWNPYLFGGQPALADIQSGALYPPHVIEALVLGWGGPLFGREIGFPVWALEWQVIAHFSLVAVGMFFFARHLGLLSGVSLRRARFGGLIASLVFTYGGYLTGFPVQQVTILEVSAWLPWVLWGIRAGIERVRRADTTPILRRIMHLLAAGAWGALAFAMAILAGHPQTVLYIFYFSLAYAVFLAYQSWRTQSSPSPTNSTLQHPFLNYLVSHIALWLIVVLLGASIAAAQILPTIEFIERSLRADLTFQAVSAGLPLNELVSILYPGFFGGSPEYVGIASLVLIGLAVVLARPRLEVFFWSGAALFSLVLAFGSNTFLYPLLYLFAPGFEAVRQQERAFLIYSFSAAMLAGYGAVVLTGPLPKAFRPTYARFEHYLRMVIGVLLGLTGFFIYGSAAATARGDEVNLFFGVLWHHIFGLIILGGMWLLLALRPQRLLRRSWGMGLLMLWVSFNLFTVNWRFHLEKPTDATLFNPNGVTQFLQGALNDNLANQKKRISLIEPARIVSGGLLPGGNNAAAIYNLQDLTGNTPLQLAEVDKFFQQMPAWRMWQLMNVRYVVDKRDIGNEGLALVFEAGDDERVYEVGDPLPRAWFVSETEVISDNNLAVARLAADDFDLRRSAVLADPPGNQLSEASTSTVDGINFESTKVSANVKATGNQLLVFSQIYFPGWQAEIGGQSVELVRVNVVQLGVIVPSGKHTVDLRFRPSSFRLGGIISIIGVVIWLIAVAEYVRR